MSLTARMPFWNSLDAVRRAHSDLELAAIVFFLLLAFFDALAHWTKDKDKEHRYGAIGIVFFFIAVSCEFAAYAYGQRNDKLSEQVIVSLSETAGDAFQKAHSALDSASTAETKAEAAREASDAAIAKTEKLSKRADALDSRVNSASQKLKKTETRLAWRHVDPQKRAGYIARLKPFAGSSVGFDFAASGGDQEAIGFANEVIRLLQDSGWKTIHLQNSFGTTTGLICRISANTPSGKALADVMRQLPDTTVTTVPENGVRFIFGSKTAP